jgi:hypothetical protein
VSEDASFFSSIFTILFALLTLSLYNYDDLAKWDGYVLTMPISKDNVVQGKYIMMLLLTGLGAIVSIIFSVLLNTLLNIDSMLPAIQNCGAGAAIVILIYCITIPFITKFGVEKARLIFFGVYIIPFIVVYFVNKTVANGSLIISEKVIRILDTMIENVYIIIPPVLFIALALSYSFSIKIYRKREF